MSRSMKAAGYQDAKQDIASYGWDYAACEYERMTDTDHPYNEMYTEGYLQYLDESI